MELDPPTYGRYWALAVAALDITAAKAFLSTTYLLVTYPKAAPAPPAAYRELLGGLLQDLGAPIPTPGDRSRDFPDDLDRALPARGKAMKAKPISQSMARKSGLPNPPWLKDDNAGFSVDAFSYLKMRKFADRNPDRGDEGMEGSGGHGQVWAFDC